MKNKNQVYLVDQEALNFFKNLEGGLNFEVGSGKGYITKVLQNPRMGVQSDLKFLSYHEKEHIIWEDYLDYLNPELLKPLRVVGNLPFANSLAYIIHTSKIFPLTEEYFFIVQKQVGEKFFSPGKLGLLVRWFYDITSIMEVDQEGFEPKVKVKGVLLSFKPRGETMSHFLQMKSLISKIINPRKMLKSFFLELPQSLRCKRITDLKPAEEEDLKNFLISKIN